MLFLGFLSRHTIFWVFAPKLAKFSNSEFHFKHNCVTFKISFQQLERESPMSCVLLAALVAGLQEQAKADFLSKEQPYGSGAHCWIYCAYSDTHRARASLKDTGADLMEFPAHPDQISAHPSTSPALSPARLPVLCEPSANTRTYPLLSRGACSSLQPLLSRKMDPLWLFCSPGGTALPCVLAPRACSSPCPGWCWHAPCQGHGAKWSRLISISWLKKDKT